jgi:hypothetical protein
MVGIRAAPEWANGFGTAWRRRYEPKEKNNDLL